ncbi:hypothetical protein RZS08_11945, partial [Arthrospira platensis SPKY1]|nr:hypothetical protein [Arthrospira platensis SPKY1]
VQPDLKSALRILAYKSVPALRTFRVRPKKELHAGTDQSYDKKFKVSGKKADYPPKAAERAAQGSRREDSPADRRARPPAQDNRARKSLQPLLSGPDDNAGSIHRSACWRVVALRGEDGGILCPDDGMGFLWRTEPHYYTQLGHPLRLSRFISNYITIKIQNNEKVNCDFN